MINTPRESLDLAEALRIARGHIIIRLTPRSIALWSPGLKQIPGAIRAALWQHRAEVRALLIRSDVAVCPSPDRHRRYWSRVEGQQYCCAMCKQLAPWINGEAKKKKEQAA